MLLFDTHCHLTHDKLAQEVPGIIERARQAGLMHAITIGTGTSDGQACRELVQAHPDFLHCSVGIDPFNCFDAGDRLPQELDTLKSLLASGDFVAVGEIGMDYHYDLKSAAEQRQDFEAQLALAEEFDLPVIIHVRDAHDDMLACLADHPNNRGVIHSFTGGPAEAERYLALKTWMLSYNGICTFKNAQDVAAAAAMTPNDQLLVETDSPYLAPVPLRGKRCEPAYVEHTARFLADIRGQRFDDICAWTCKNACRLFQLPELWHEPKAPWEEANFS